MFEQIPVQLAKDNKKFQISKVAKGARFKDYRGCIEWLRDAGIINICYCLDFPELPLRGNYDDTKYKIYFFDTGLNSQARILDTVMEYIASHTFVLFS